MNGLLTVGCCTVRVSQGGSPVWVDIKINGLEAKVRATDLPDIAHAIERARQQARVEMKRQGNTQEIDLT